MQLHNLKRKNKNKKSRQVGRGSKRGKTSGRGTKGQSARAGNKKRPEIRDFIKRLPKLRGRGKNLNTTIETKAGVVNLGAIDLMYKAGDSVTAQSLVERGLARMIFGALPKIKILGTGELTKKLTFVDCLFSGSAKEKIEKAGGTITAK